MARQVLENGVILPAEYSDDWYDDMTSNLTKLDDVIGSDSEKLSSADVGAAALSNSYNDLDNLPTIPTKTSDLTNDSNFVDTSNSAVASGITSAKVTSYDSHIEDTDIHVTTADKTKWNNGVSQAYVFRYSSTALVASSTNSNTLLDNTDNLKVGDKVIDSSGVLFSVTAIDTVNSTFTIGSALIDLALDANVMHLSGNETADGYKTFLKYITSDGSSVGDEYSSNTRTNLWLMGNRDTEEVSGVLFDTYRQNTAQGTGIHILGLGIKENSVRYEGCRFGWYWDNNLNGYTFDFKPTTQGTNQAVKHNLGTSVDKWDTINGVFPSSLSLPDIDNKIDISSYITDLTGVNNEYTPTVNGWICVRSGNATKISILDSATNIGNQSVSSTATYLTVMAPCIANKKVYINIVCTSLSHAYFIPCQGNV